MTVFNENSRAKSLFCQQQKEDKTNSVDSLISADDGNRYDSN
jgi:hypothetical protein